MELAPQMGLCRRIVDLVETGSTLKANGLVELETIAQVSSRLVVNRTAWKQHPEMVDGWISRLRAAVKQAAE
jgi:ATP phosphoribosyltransferase